MPTTAETRARGARCLGVAAVVLLVSAGCSSSGSPSRTSPPAPLTSASAPISTTAPTTAAAVTSPVATPTSTAAGTDLSGRWSGQYSGAFSGTFTLNWQETGSTLRGTITLSEPADTLSLTGSVTGTRIRFGTVGSAAITYSGTVSGHSMSGTYQVNGAGGGNWSANTSS